MTRDRAKFLHESILKLDKYRNILSRKRQRNELSSEKPGSANLLKMGGQAHQIPAEVASSRLEDRTKNAVPNKRVRSSMAEVRVCISYQDVIFLRLLNFCGWIFNCTDSASFTVRT